MASTTRPTEPLRRERPAAARSLLGPPDGFFLPRASHAVLQLGFSLISRLRIEGQEHIPRTGPLIVVANHVSMADPPLVIAAMPRPVAVMAKEELLRSPLLGGILRLGGAFPVRRGEADRGALRAAQALLEREMAVVLFPEGTRSKSAKLQEGHKGVAFIAHRTGTPVLPAAIIGTEAFGQPASFLRRPQIAIRFGPPFQPQVDRTQPDPLQAATNEIMQRIAALLPPDRRGRYA